MAGEMRFDAESQAGTPSGTQPPPAAGDAGSNFLDSLFAFDPLDDDAVAKFNQDVGKIKELASAGPDGGGFAIEPGAGEAFVKAIDNFIDGSWPRLKSEMFDLSLRPGLGNGPYATIVAEHDVSVIDSDEASLMPNLELLENGLMALREAIQTATRSYREGDEEISMTFKSIEHE
ncbi:hypothetical protein [Amycolatopsis magusensis]|uniref:YbaB/EbfC DNA-binding family protein n=1 Tax=Amycolatopsis magusensis TaxID=882444 RepID=A0ABS4PQY1_9PSEU|nr:hypothetical protein [Amycolatopsis magusensis]MBP2181269.1 hypothetical protein [Amycolatopsis magusensis]